MDMPLTTFRADADTVRLVLDRVVSGTDVLIAAERDEARALLDAVAEGLAESRQRAIRVSVPADGMSLSGLMAGITGRQDLATHDDAVLELGFRALTAADEAYDSAVLLVGGAEGLQRPALRYIQFACRAAKGLRVVLAGSAELSSVLAHDDLAGLRPRLAPLPAAPAAVSRTPGLRAPTSAAAPVARAPVLRAPVARTPIRRARRVPGWAGAGVGMAASLALGLWIGRGGLQGSAIFADATPPAARMAEAPAQPATEATAPLPLPPAVPPSTQAAAPPAPAEAAPRPAPRVAEGPVQPVVPATPVRAATPVEQASAPEAALPTPPVVAPRPPRQARAAPPRRWDTRPEAGAQGYRRAAPAPPTVVARPPSEPIRLEGNDGAPRSPRSWQPEDTFGPMYSSLGRPRSFIGTYSANPDGTRAFRMEP